MSRAYIFHSEIEDRIIRLEKRAAFLEDRIRHVFEGLNERLTAIEEHAKRGEAIADPVP